MTIDGGGGGGGGATRAVRGACHHDCPDSCGWIVTVDDSGPVPVALTMRGDPEHPSSRGELCPKVNRFLDRAASPDRLLHPMRRVGPKGSGRFERITWDDALDEIAARLHEVIDTHGAEAVLPYSSAGNQSLLSMFVAGHRFFHHLGATRLERAICGVTAGVGTAMAYGTGASLDPSEMEHSRLIVLWGTNTRLTNRHLWPTVQRARAQGARLVVVDPIRTSTARAVDESCGDRFVQPLPGTDVAMILAMMHVLFRDGLTDDDWIARHTVGVDELRAEAERWPPERAARVCGVDATVITELAVDVATTRPTALRTLIGPEHHANGASFFRALSCLPALTGAWRDRGGGFSRSVGHWTEGGIDLAAAARPDLLGRDLPRSVNMSRLGSVLTELDPPIHALVVWNCNPLVTTPNANAIRAGLERDDLFTVVHEQFLTDTARYADIVLPATTQIEADDVVVPWGHLWITHNEAAVPPAGESCSNTELFRRLAAAVGLEEESLHDDDDALVRQVLPGIDLDDLKRRRWIRAPYPADGRPWGDPDGATPIPTATGRVELASDAMGSLGFGRVPTFVAPPESAVDDDSGGRYPLQLLTPKRHVRFLNSSYPQLPKHGPPKGGPYVELHTDDAVFRGLHPGDVARVVNDRGSVEVEVRTSDHLRPGVVAIPFGWWSADHRDGSVANSLTSDALVDAGGGVAFGDTLVEVVRVDRAGDPATPVGAAR
ncbi:molybdopterin-containing oxidoreductase family protein [Ilumatobacter sp.]|uniref:molybdopterin-containing oxidoreductase family protein n=1 Tax=Ilumatobacter sp. TaxID=1967498 RepID=UPI003B52D91B